MDYIRLFKAMGIVLGLIGLVTTFGYLGMHFPLFIAILGISLLFVIFTIMFYDIL